MPDRMLRTVFDWEHFAVYLSGPIDFAHDGGTDWRDDWTDGLVDMGIDSQKIYNPCRKPLHGAQFNLDKEGELGRAFRKEKNWDGLMDLMSQIMHIDLRLVDKADIILVNFPKIGDSHPAVRKWQNVGWNVDNLDACVDWDHHGKGLCEALADMRVPTYGTIHEIVVAHLQRKPIFVVWEGEGKESCSSWIMKLVGHDHVFPDFASLLDRLSNIANGKTSFNANEWLLLDPK